MGKAGLAARLGCGDLSRQERPLAHIEGLRDAVVRHNLTVRTPLLIAFIIGQASVRGKLIRKRHESRRDVGPTRPASR